MLGAMAAPDHGRVPCRWQRRGRVREMLGAMTAPGHRTKSSSVPRESVRGTPCLHLQGVETTPGNLSQVARLLEIL
jgi:hypothetical protein